MSQRTCFLVLGMHRSGTSALTRVLNLLGATLPDNLLGPNKGNELGHWEPLKLVDFNDRLLQEIGSAWNDVTAVTLEQVSTKRMNALKRELTELISSEYSDAQTIVIKDPRVCKVADLYLEVLEELNFHVRVIVPFRNPLDVAASLNARDGMKTSKGILMWLRYVLDAEMLSRESDRIFLEFNQLLEFPEKSIACILKSGKEKLIPLQASENTDALDFLDTNQKHHFSNEEALAKDPLTRSWAITLFQQMAKANGKNLTKAHTKRFDDIRMAFDSATDILTTYDAEMQQDIQSAEGELATAKERTKELEDINAAHLITNQRLQDMFDEANLQSISSADELEHTNQKLQESEGLLKAVNKKLNDSEAAVTSTIQRLQETDALLAASSSRLNQTEEKLTQTVHERDAIISSLTVAKSEIQTLSDELKVSSMEQERLRAFKEDVQEHTKLGIIYDSARAETNNDFSPLVSIIIPVKNGLPEFQRVIDAIKTQELEEDFEVIVIDSGSKDGSKAIVPLEEDQRFRLVEIDPTSFGHGKTRNLGVHLSRGEFCAFLTHDAAPANSSWLAELIKPLQEDPNVAGVFGRHMAYEDATPFTKWELDTHFSGLKDWEIVSLTDAREYARNQGLRQVYHFYSDNSSCMRKSVWEEFPYPDVNFAEDQIWAKQIVEAGYKKAYAWDSVVFHSHDYSIWERFQRSYDESLALNQYFGYELCPTKKQLFGQAWRTTLRDLGLAFRKGWWLTAPIDVIKKPFDNIARQAGYFMGSTKSEFAKKHDKKFSRDRRMQAK